VSPTPPSFIVLITDQTRRPQHWPTEPGWLDSLMPNEAELARTGVRFNRAFCNTAMCSPSRATLLTSRWPAEHGVDLTLTAADLRPDLRNSPSVAATMGRILARREAPPRRVLRQFARGALRIGESRGGETELPKDLPNLATLLAARGYRVSYKGKWHLTHPSGGPGSMLGGWSATDAARIERDYGFTDWEAPDAGENAKAEHFGGGNAAEGDGWDEVYTQQTERWLADVDPEQPFCLVVSLVNPHDVLGYPASYVTGGYGGVDFRELGVALPSTVDENLSTKPAVHSLMRMGMNAYMGPLRDVAARLDYVNFYAYLHRVVDEKIGRIVAALGDPEDPASLRSRTVVVRCADHGEMGLAHGGLRQKCFNAYEETISVPLVVSNPVLFPDGGSSDALVSLADILPTILGMTGGGGEDGLRGEDLTPILADAANASRERAALSPVDLGAVLDHPAPAPTVQDAIHFTYDDHQAGTALTEAPGQPNRIRAIRTESGKYAAYFDPRGQASAEHEMYDLDRDPHEVENLLDVRTGRVRNGSGARLRGELTERLDVAMDRAGTRPEAGLPTPG